MKRTPEQEEARRARQAHERSIPRCSVAGCRQGRTMASDMCGLHLREHEAYREKRSEKESLIERIYEAESVDDLRSILVDIVEKIG